MKYLLPVTVFLLGFTARAQNTKDFSTITAKPFVLGETVELFSEELSEERILNVYLPDGYYQDTTAHYPVIYLLDGSADEDFIHIAGLVQFATFPWVSIIPESIVVGIANTDRKRDFTFPSRIAEDQDLLPTSGRSEKFMAFIEKELQPFVEKHYRTNVTKTIIGQSLGGLLATEILWKKPRLFSHYIIVSPSLWWDNGSLLEQEPRFTPGSPESPAVFIAVGNEGEIMEAQARKLAEILQQDPEKNKVHFQHFPGQDHANILHLAVYRSFEHLFKEQL